MNEQASKHYQTQQIMTASPATLVFMLLDKTIVCLKEAIRAIEAKDIEGRWRSNARAMEIISHLKGTLDHDKGGVISRNLDQLYSFMLNLLPKVDFANDPKAAQSVIDLLVPFRDSWKELASRGTVPMQEAAKLASQPNPATVAKPASPAPAAPAKRPEPPSNRPRLAISA